MMLRRKFGMRLKKYEKKIIYDEIDSNTEGSILDAINKYDSNITSNPNIRWIFSAYEEFNYGVCSRNFAGLINK